MVRTALEFDVRDMATTASMIGGDGVSAARGFS